MEEVTPEEVTAEEVGLHASDLIVLEARTIEVPGTGELVSSDDPLACARALDDLRNYESHLKEVKSALSDVVIEYGLGRGEQTVAMPDGRKAVISPDHEWQWDAEGLERALRSAGMPEDRIRAIVRETVSYSVVAGEAKRAAAAKPEYAAAVEAHRQRVEKKRYVSVKR